MVLKAIAWTACVLVVFGIATERAARLDGRDIHFQQGYAMGSLLTAFAVAFAIGFAIQRARKCKGFPPWIGLIASASAAR